MLYKKILFHAHGRNIQENAHMQFIKLVHDCTFHSLSPTEKQPQTFSSDPAQQLGVQRGNLLMRNTSPTHQSFQLKMRPDAVDISPCVHHVFSQSVVRDQIALQWSHSTWWNTTPWHCICTAIGSNERLCSKSFHFVPPQSVTSGQLYLPNHLNRIIKVRINDHWTSDAPIAVCCDDANTS